MQKETADEKSKYKSKVVYLKLFAHYNAKDKAIGVATFDL